MSLTGSIGALKAWWAETFPGADSTDNLNSSDAIGNKKDAAVTSISEVASLLGYIKGLLNITNDIDTHVIAGNHHEKVYPYDSAGVPVTPGNTEWGNTFIIIPINGVTDNYGWGSGDIAAYNITGFIYMLSSGASKPNTVMFMRIKKTTAQELTGTAAAAEKVIPISDTSGYFSGDYVWITDDDTPGGELCLIDTIQENTSLTVVVDLVNDYTIAQNAVVYLARRRTANILRSIWDKFAHSDTKSIIRHDLHLPRSMEAGDGLICRAYGIDDASGVMLISIVYDDDVS